MVLEQRKTVGLALGGGVARGLAHIGVLKVLVGAGIPIDFIAGSSAGSLVATAYAAGFSVQEIEAWAEGMRWRNLARLVWPRRGLVTFDPLERWLESEFGKITFADLKIPLSIMATHLETGLAVELNEGPVARAAHASCAVPGFVEPVMIDGQLLADGNFSDTIPTHVLRQRGADFIIGVDIFISAVRPRWGPLGMFFTALEILIQRAGGGTQDADCLISPKVSGLSYVSFSSRKILIDLGEQAACEKLPEILRALEIPQLAEGT